MDRINPIYLKEARQVVKNGTFYSILYVAYLSALFVAVMVLESAQNSRRVYDGTAFFNYFVIGCGLVTCILFPLYYSYKFSTEIRDKDSSLFFTTPMSPMRIMVGKFSFGASYCIFFQLLALPFFLLCSIGRGVSLELIIVVSIYFLFASTGIMSLALFMGATLNKLGIVGRASTLFTCAIGGLALGGAFGLSGYFNNSLSSRGDFYASFALILAMILFDATLFFLCSRAQITVAYANCNIAIKGMLLLRLVLTPLVFYLAQLCCDFADILASFWFYLGFSYLCMNLFFSFLRNVNYGKRVRLSISTDPLRRSLQMLIYSGPINDFLWGIIFGILTICAGMLFKSMDIINYAENDTLSLVCLLIYAAVWALVGIFTKRIFANNQSANIIAINVTVVCMIIMVLLPALVNAAFSSYASTVAGVFMNPFMMFTAKRGILWHSLTLDGAILFVLLIMNYKSFTEAFATFKPLIRLTREQALENV
jgi:hypothetical protein